MVSSSKFCGMIQPVASSSRANNKMEKKEGITPTINASQLHQSRYNQIDSKLLDKISILYFQSNKGKILAENPNKSQHYIRYSAFSIRICQVPHKEVVNTILISLSVSYNKSVNTRPLLSFISQDRSAFSIFVQNKAFDKLLTFIGLLILFI